MTRSDFITPFGPHAPAVTGDEPAMGIKGANLVTMSGLGIPVPPGFVVHTSMGARHTAEDSVLASELQQATRQEIAALDSDLDWHFADPERPLLISVRSGAAVSMPGMMDTVLNLGLSDAVMPAFARQTGNPRFAWDTYRRFIQSYSQVVLGLDADEFEMVLEELRARENCGSDSELSVEVLQEAVSIFHQIVNELSGAPFPQEPFDQLDGALLAVFRSWNTPRAIRYRDMHDMSHEGGTAAIVQTMVFGNRDENSCTGVYFTRNPSTGEKKPYGEFMVNAQGEEVVSGIRTPQELTEEARIHAMSTTASMERLLPDAFAQLLATGDKLERHFQDMQDIEFTVESGTLYLLQTRSAKRTPKATVRIAVDMANENIISRAEAVGRCNTETLAPMLVSKVDPNAGAPVFTKGLPASPGAVSGEIIFDSDAAVAAADEGRSVILVRPETDPKDVHGMNAAKGVLTTRGGMTSHAAVVARGMNKPCITAAMTLKIDANAGTCASLGTELRQGDTITIDGGSGNVYVGVQPVVTPEPDGELATLLSWRDT